MTFPDERHSLITASTGLFDLEGIEDAGGEGYNDDDDEAQGHSDDDEEAKGHSDDDDEEGHSDEDDHDDAEGYSDDDGEHEDDDDDHGGPADAKWYGFRGYLVCSFAGLISLLQVGALLTTW